MPVDARWALQSMGFDLSAASRASPTPAQPENPQVFARQIIDVDSESAPGRAFADQATRSKPLSEMTPIPWPAELAPPPERRR